VWVRAELRLAVTLLAFGGTAGAAGGQQVSVLVVDAQSQTPVVAVQLTLGEAEQARATGNDGRARFTSLPMGKLTLVARRLGYAPLTRVLQLPRDSVVTIQLRASAMSLSAVTVQGAARSDATFQPTTVLDGAALDRALGTSIAATLAGEPGITQRTNGPVATAPIIRGLGGDRVLVLEDGLRLGDIATTAPDHAITADAISARRIEVIRGPAGLLYGSNTLGGVINVIREDVPRAPIDRVTGVMSLQGESVTTGVTGGAMASLSDHWRCGWKGAGVTPAPARRPPANCRSPISSRLMPAWVSAGRDRVGTLEAVCDDSRVNTACPPPSADSRCRVRMSEASTSTCSGPRDAWMVSTVHGRAL
jgi:iron complex outermembrane receptor protein